MNTSYGPNREMFRSFSEIKGYEGYLMGSLSCVRRKKAEKYADGRNGSGTAYICRERQNYAVLKLQEGCYSLTMTLLRPEHPILQTMPEKTTMQKQGEKNDMAGQGQVVARHSFTADEVLEFVESVRDMNGIHRTEDPIVPGLLMAEWFFAAVPSAGWETIEFRFHVPAYAGQALCISKETENDVCHGEDAKQTPCISKETKNDVCHGENAGQTPCISKETEKYACHGEDAGQALWTACVTVMADGTA